MITKTHTGAGAAAAVVVGTGVGLTISNGWGKESEVDWSFSRDFTVLSWESDFSSTYSNSSTVGKIYGGFLVGTYGTKEGDEVEELNIAWWDKSYKKWQTDLGKSKPLSNTFADNTKVTTAYSPKTGDNSNVNTALNKVCESVYKKNSSEVDLLGIYSVDENKEETKLAEDLLSYCSPLGGVPKKIQDSENGFYEKKTKNNNKHVLGLSRANDYISVFNKDNKIFWHLMNDHFFGRESTQGKGDGLDSTSNELFHTLYSEKSKTSERKTVRETCAEAYLLYEDTKNNKIGSFCSWRYISNNN